MIQVLNARENVKKPAVYECAPGALTKPSTGRNLTNYDVMMLGLGLPLKPWLVRPDS